MSGAAVLFFSFLSTHIAYSYTRRSIYGVRATTTTKSGQQIINSLLEFIAYYLLSNQLAVHNKMCICNKPTKVTADFPFCFFF